MKKQLSFSTKTLNMFKTIALLFFFLLINNSIGYSQTEVVVGDSIVETSLRIQKGALIVGDQTFVDSIPGTIKFVNGAFMGFDGSNWVNLSPQEKYILGPSNLISDGSFEYGTLTGIEAATANCKDSYPNEPTAHFYTPEEIDAAIGNGNINGIENNTTFWTVMHLYNGFSLTNTANNNCYSLLHHHGGLARGTTITIFINSSTTNLTGIYTNYKYGIGCNLLYPVICGR